MIVFIKKLNVKDHLDVSGGVGRHFNSHLSKSSLKCLGKSHGIRETSDNRAQDKTYEELVKQLDSNLSESDISDWVSKIMVTQDMRFSQIRT